MTVTNKEIFLKFAKKGFFVAHTSFGERVNLPLFNKNGVLQGVFEVLINGRPEAIEYRAMYDYNGKIFLNTYNSKGKKIAIFSSDLLHREIIDPSYERKGIASFAFSLLEPFAMKTTNQSGNEFYLSTQKVSTANLLSNKGYQRIDGGDDVSHKKRASVEDELLHLAMFSKKKRKIFSKESNPIIEHRILYKRADGSVRILRVKAQSE